MSSLKSQSPLKHPQTQISFLPRFAQSGESGVLYLMNKKWKSIAQLDFQFLQVIHAQLGRSPAISSTIAMSVQSPVLIQNHVAPSHGSPVRVLSPLSFHMVLHCPSAFFETAKRESSAWLLHLAFLLPKPHGQGNPLSPLKTVWLSKKHSCSAWVYPSVNLPL